MTPAQIAGIPDALLAAETTDGLQEWLRARGLRRSLFELDDERRRRGIPTFAARRGDAQRPGKRVGRHPFPAPHQEPRRSALRGARPR